MPISRSRATVPRVQREETDTPRVGPSLAFSAVLTAIVVVGDAVTWFPFALACSIGDNTEEPWRTFCDSELHLAPAVGGAAAFIGAVVARRWRRWSPLVVGLSLGTVAALAPWILVGDPAGNFGGVLSFVELSRVRL
jgi:hypothetical protein